MKILTVCQRANCRSVAAAYILKDVLGVNDTIAMGVQTASPETQSILFNWADEIVVVAGEDIYSQIPEEFLHKTSWVDIGPDIWRDPMHRDLQTKLLPLLEEVIHNYSKE